MLILIAVLPAVGLILTTTMEQKRQIVAGEKAEARRMATLVALEEEHLFGATKQILIALGDIAEANASNPATCRARFASLLECYHRYANFGVIDLKGNVVCSALPMDVAVNAADRAFFQRALKTHDFAVGDYEIGRITGKPTINFGYPVLDKSGQVQGVVFAAVDLFWLGQVEFQTERLFPSGTVLIKVDSNGVVLFHHPHPEKYLGHPAPEMAFLKARLSQGEGAIKATGPDGVPRLYIFTKIFSHVYKGDIYLILGVPTASLFASADQVLKRNLILLAVSLLLAGTVAWGVSEVSILSRVNALVDASRQMAKGNLTTRTGLPYKAGRLGVLARAFDEMAASLEERTTQLTQAYDETIAGWAKTLELRDLETKGHSERVVPLTLRVARAMGMSEEELIHVRRGALLHDIGKLSVPDHILLKQGPLTDEEWKIMRMHPVYAYELLSSIDFLRPALDIPYCHHERWDGSGYPRGLKGEEIPLAARIFAVVDVWDALHSDRPYRPAWPEQKIYEYIREQAGKQFDPAVVEVFLSIVKKS